MKYSIEGSLNLPLQTHIPSIFSRTWLINFWNLRIPH